MTILPTSWRTRAAALLLCAASVAAGAAELPSISPGPPADERNRAHDELKRLLEAGEYAAAAEQARKAVALTEQLGAGHDEELQVALMNLALAEFQAGDYLAAESGYRRVIELIEASGRTARPRLARAEAGLGLTYHAAGRHDLAAVSLGRAIALSRRADGLFNTEQLPLLDKQADSLTELGQTEQALLAQRYALRVVARRHGESSIEFARQLESLGRWYTRVRAYEPARNTLRQAIELAEARAGADSSELAGPLTGFADNARRWLTDPVIRELAYAENQRSSLFQNSMMPIPPSLSPGMIATEGLKALERAASIVDADPDSAPSLIAGVHSQLGDWHTARQLPDRARPSYVRAWQAAEAAPDGARLRQVLFGMPQLIHFAIPDGWDRYAGRPPEEVERRDVVVELTVTAAGSVRDPRITSGGEDERLANQALRAAQSARYRPRMADGQPVDTADVRFVQPFYVLREKAPETPPAQPPPGTQGGA